MPEHVVFKLPIIIEIRESDGFVKYFCEQCQSLTGWTQPASNPGEAVWHTCIEPPVVLHKEHLGMETKADGTVRYHCEKCEGWTQWIVPASSPGGKVVHSCREKVKIPISPEHSIHVQERPCIVGNINGARINLGRVIENAVSPEAKAWAKKVLAQFDITEELDVIEQAARANLENSAPMD